MLMQSSVVLAAWAESWSRIPVRYFAETHC